LRVFCNTLGSSYLLQALYFENGQFSCLENTLLFESRFVKKQGL
jgi:hypothetical protein